MGLHRFKNCRPDQRFTSTKNDPDFECGRKWLVDDWDQRRTITAHVVKQECEEDFVFQALARCIDDLPADAVLVTISEDGKVLSSTANPLKDGCSVPLYPPRSEFPSDVATVRRRDLTEIDRLGFQVDLTTYQSRQGETRQVVFSYYITEFDVSIFWHEANCTMRMPAHPNLVPFDSLVVDTVEDIDVVVGFTTRDVPGGTLAENKDRVFKLKYLQQLIDVADHLNLHLGIVHGDICRFTLLINAETDSIQLVDFNKAAKLGWDGDLPNGAKFEYDEDRNDVKFIVFTVYEIITREFEFRSEFHLRQLKTSRVLRKAEWDKHPDVQLDSPVTEYHRMLKEWVAKRRKIDKKINHFTKATQPLDWPPLPESLSMDYSIFPIRRPANFRCTLRSTGRDFLKWQRPPTRDMPPPKGWRLLATGEVVHDNRDSSPAAET